MNTQYVLQHIIDAYRLLCPRHRRKLVALQVIFLVAAVVQVLGIASIAPFIAVVSNPELIGTNMVLSKFNDFIGAPEISQFLTIFASVVGLTILFSNLVAGGALWLLFRFSMAVGAELKMRLYHSYMSSQYVFFTQHNSAELINNINGQTPRFVYMVLTPVLHLFAQSFIAAIIIIGLIMLDPILALASLVIVAGIYAIIYFTIHHRIATAGRFVSYSAQRSLMLLNESIGGVKEVKLRGLEQSFEADLDKTVRKGLNAEAYIILSGDLPKFIVETVIFSSILLLAIYFLSVYGSGGEAISVVSIYAMAGYKILPSIQQIYKSVSQIRSNGDVIGGLRGSLENAARFARQPSGKPGKSELKLTGCNISLENIYYKFPGQHDYALKDLSLLVPENSMTALVGASGAGKSTCADVILGLIKPERGRLLVGGQVIDDANLRSWQRNIGFVPQNIFLLDDTVGKNIAFGVPQELIDQELVRSAAKRANILDFIDADPNGLDMMVGEKGGKISGGQRQRIGIARALYNNPSILVLDEATSALDNITEDQVLQELAVLSKSTTVIMIAHRMSTVRKADHVIYFENGKATGSGSYEELAATHSGFKDLLKGKLTKK